MCVAVYMSVHVLKMLLNWLSRTRIRALVDEFFLLCYSLFAFSYLLIDIGCFQACCSSVWVPFSCVVIIMKSVTASMTCLKYTTVQGAADAEIKVTFVENPQLTNVLLLKPEVGQNSHTCAPHCQEFLLCPTFYFPSWFTLNKLLLRSFSFELHKF